MTTEKPLIEKIINIPNEDEHNFYYFLPKDVAHAVERLKDEVLEEETWKEFHIISKIDEIFGDLK